ncbi:hypothetical protein PtoMrB4_10160 [Metapseudomonas otitidis]|uniref:Uncharacterized protein n=1 Tax=Metapseudomonas otitidis TaxID=319939 RepID=A0A679GHB1_9GAMM|nr:hypothetical protein PtoMrB4_10160 [Pseudomonas otitidis]
MGVSSATTWENLISTGSSASTALEKTNSEAKTAPSRDLYMQAPMQMETAKPAQKGASPVRIRCVVRWSTRPQPADSHRQTAYQVVQGREKPEAWLLLVPPWRTGPVRARRSGSAEF